LTRLNNRTLINQPVDDASSALQVNGAIRSTGEQVSGGNMTAQNYTISQAAGKIWLENTRARTLRWTANNGSGVSGLAYSLQNDGSQEVFYANDYGDFRVLNGVYADRSRTSTFGMWFDGTNYVRGWGNTPGYWLDYFQVSNGDRHWVGASADLMLLTGAGTLRVFARIELLNDPNFWIGGNTADRYLNYTANCYDSYQLATGYRAWVVNGVANMSLGGSGVLNVRDTIISANAVTATSGIFAVSDNSCGLQQVGTNRFLYWMTSWYDYIDMMNGNRHWYNYDKIGMSLSGGGDLTVYNNIYAKYYCGGSFNAGVLNCINNVGTICFNWADRGGTWMASYRISETNDLVIPTATNTTELAYQPGGGPIGVVMNGYSFGRTLYGIFVDATSDERIKHSVAPTKVDALEAVRNVPITEFFIHAAARAALSPVSLYDKPKVKSLGDAYVPIGIVAQQAQPFIPEMVYATKQDEDRFDKEAIPDDLHNLVLQASVPYLIRAIQQLLERVETLEANAPTSKEIH
jgi:hypothetical protein